jgi:hypothetical protein
VHKEKIVYFSQQARMQWRKWLRLPEKERIIMDFYKKYFIVIILFLIYISGSILKAFVNSQYERINAQHVIESFDGNYIIVGHKAFYSISKKRTKYEDADIYVIKTDNNGNLMWEKRYGSPKSEFANEIQKTSDSCFIIGGHSRTSGGSFYLFKIDGNGDSLWAKTYTDSFMNYKECNSVKQTKDNGYILAGYTGSPCTGPDYIYIVKTDDEGNQCWAKRYGNNNGAHGRGIIQTPDSGYVIVGYSYIGEKQRSDILVIKIDSFGEELWSKNFGSNLDDEPWDILQTADNGYIIVGSTGLYKKRNKDIYVVRLDSKGDILWEKTYGGGGFDFGYSIKKASDNQYIIGGKSSSFGERGESYYLLKIDEEGNKQWVKSYETTNPTMFRCDKLFDRTSEGGYVLIGNTKGGVSLLKTDSKGIVLWRKAY